MSWLFGGGSSGRSRGRYDGYSEDDVEDDWSSVSGTDSEDDDDVSSNPPRRSGAGSRRRSTPTLTQAVRKKKKSDGGWFGFGGSTSAKERKKKATGRVRSSRKAPFSQRVLNGAFWLSERFMPKTSQGWGLLVLMTLFTFYAIDFYHLSREVEVEHSVQVSKGSMLQDTSREADRNSLPFSKAGERGGAAPPPVQGTSSESTSSESGKGKEKKKEEEPKKNEGAGEAPPVPQPPAVEEKEAPPPPPPAAEEKTVSETKHQTSARILASTGDEDPGGNPFDRDRADLTVPGETGKLSIEDVSMYYGKLAKAYLAPFKGGISRNSLLDILKRRTYALTPPGASKGVQSMLFQIKENRLYLMDPYEVPKNSKPFYRSRINEMIWILSRMVGAGRLPDTEFLVSIHDCVQTVSKDHQYRVAKYVESNPSFTIVGCNFSDNIPFPMWEGDESRGGGYQSWEERMKEYAEDPHPWETKLAKAVFRGGIRQSTFFPDKPQAEAGCASVGRARLAILMGENPYEFDVSVSGKCAGQTYSLNRLSPSEHHKFKYVIYAEGNCFWADRINRQVFGPSVVIKQETPCGQFFEPLLKPMTHYVPTDFFFTDTPDRIAWLKENDKDAKQIVKNANEFAWNFLSLTGIEAYVEVLLKEYTQLLSDKDIKVENGAKDVTGLSV